MRTTYTTGRGVATDRGFTLVELMVAVALVLLIIVGVNEVFRLTSDTVGAGQSLSSALRDQRAVRSTLEDDFAHVAPDAPALIIRNQAVAAFRTRDEQLGSVNPNNPLLVDLDRDGLATGPGEVISPATPGDRVRRVDSITFFVRKPQSRQTGNLTAAGGNPSDLLGTTVGQEAFVTYGHLRLPNNRTTGPNPPSFFDPAQPDYSATDRNDSNRYATQFVLGRHQILMVPFLTRDGETAWRPQARQNTNAPFNLSPLAMASSNLRTQASPNPQVVNGVNLWDSRVDLAAGEPGAAATSQDLWASTPLTLASFAQRLAQYDRDVLASGGPGNGAYTSANNIGLWYLPVSSNSYGDQPGPRSARESLVYRVNANPFGARGYQGVNNLLATTLAQSSPVFLPRCTSFIVEYAGDFITQDNRQFVGAFANQNFGVGYAPVPDGEIDYVVHKGTRRIRWYGLPRYTNSGDVDATSSGPGDYLGPRVAGTASTVTFTGPDGISRTVRNSNLMPDVVPLSDILAAINNQTTRAGNVAEFERIVMTNQTIQGDGQFFYDLEQSALPVRANTFLPPQPNYADTTVTGNSAFSLRRANYVTAWRGGGPKLIRITLTLEDPTSRTNTSQTYEYVFSLPN